MKISFWIPAVVLYVVRVAFSNSIQVGTVLFTTTDLVRKCWTESDKSLLKARLIMQDVLPDPDCIDFSNPDVVAILVEYFHSCYKIISMNTYGKIQNLMYLALSDALGGYLRGYVLPFTRKAYYAGQVKYLDAKKLFQLYEDIKVFLKTNGVGWIEPQRVCPSKIHVRPLVITGGLMEACKELYVIEEEGKLHCINPHSKNEKEDIPNVEFLKNQKSSFRADSEKLSKTPKRIPGSKLKGKQNPGISIKGKRFDKENRKVNFDNFRNSSRCSQNFLKDLAAMFSINRTRKGVRVGESSEFSKPRCERSCSENLGSLKRVVVPLPVLDDCVTPHSIAVPFVKQPFRNLKSGSSAFILEYYYLAVVKCFIAKGNTRLDLMNFNEQLLSWLQCQVLPRLSDEQWYPGFGGVLRVLQTIKKFGTEKNFKDPALHDIAFLFDSGAEFEVQESFNNKGKNKVREVEDFAAAPYSRRHVITAIIIVSMIWLFIFCALAFYCQATRGRRLLYEGIPRAREPITSKNENNVINLQFLIKFFKRSDGGDRERVEEVCAFNTKTKNLPSCKPAAEKENSIKPKTLKEKIQLALEDSKYFTPFFPCVLPAKPYLTAYGAARGQKPDERLGGGGKIRNQGQGDQIQMLWKKPSCSVEGRDRRIRKKRYPSTISATGSEGLFGRTTSISCSACLEEGSKYYSTEKQTSTCYCSESCPFVQTTTTTSSTLLAEKLSSATLEFFEEVIGKRKLKQSSTQDSTAESETECSTTSETDY